MIIVAIALFCLAATTWASRSLQLLIVSNATVMVCVPFLAGTTFHAFGYASTVGNLFFATVIYGLTLKHRIYGRAEAQRAVNNILFALVFAFGLILLINAHRPTPIYEIPSRMIPASFISFWFVQSLFIHILDRYAKDHPVLCIPLATVAMHALGTLIFFPGTFFGVLSNALLLQFMIAGWLVKVAFVVLSIPFLLYALRTARRRAPC